MKTVKELVDADDVIHKLQSWSESYPTDIFPEITEQDIEYINAVNPNLSARFFANVGRHFIKKGFEPAIDMLRRQQANNALQDEAYLSQMKEIEALKAKLSLWEEFGREVVGCNRNEGTR